MSDGTGTVFLDPSGVVAGTYTLATVTVDDEGIVTAISNGTPTSGPPSGSATGDLGGSYPSPTVVATHLSTPLPVIQGGTGSFSPSLIAGTNVTVTGVWPNQTISASPGSGGPPTGSAGGDLGSTYPNPTVTATHLASPLPILQGGTGSTTANLTGGTNVTVTGTWPNQTIAFSGSSAPSGTAGGDLGSTYPNPTVVATHLTAPLPIAQGGTGISSPVPSLVAGTNISITGSWPNQTVSATGTVPSGAAGGDLGGTYPNPTVLSLAHYTGPLPVVQGGTGTTTPSIQPGTGISVTGTWPSQTISMVSPSGGDLTGAWPSTTVTSTHLTAALPIAQGGTGTGTTPSLIAGTNITVTGSWPNQTITATAGSGGPPTGTAGGDLGGTYPNPTVVGLTHYVGPLPIAQGGTGSATANLTAGTNISISGTWPNQTINATGSAPTGTAGGDLASTYPNPQVVNTHLTNPLPVLQGGTGSQGPSLIAGTNVTVTGSWPNQTIAVSGTTPSGAASGDLGGTYPGPQVVSTSLTNPLPVAQGGTGTAIPSLSAGAGITLTGAWPNTNIASTAVGAASGDLAGTFPSPTVTGTHLSAPLPIAQGGTGTGTLPTLTGGTGISISGTWPNQTVTATGTGGAEDLKNFIADYGGVADGTPYAATGTDNTTALTTALNSGNPLYIPPGFYYLASPVLFGTKDCYVICDGTFVVANVGPNLQFAPGAQPTNPTGWSTQQTMTGFTYGYRCATATVSGGGITTAGTGFVLNDIVEVSQGVSDQQPFNLRMAARFQVTGVSGTTVTQLTLIDPGCYMTNPPPSNPSLTAITGSGSGLTVNNITWTTPPSIGQRLVSQITIGGTNTLSADNCVLTLQDGTVLRIADKIKIASNQVMSFNYSSGNGSTSVVSSSVNGIGPRVVTGGTGYAVNDTLTFGVLGSTLARGTHGLGPQNNTPTAAVLKVLSVTSAGAITSVSVTSGGTYDRINYYYIAPTATSGSGTGATFHLTFTNTSSFPYSEMMEITQFTSSSTILLNRPPYLNHIFDGGTPMIFRKLPTTRLYWRGGSLVASGDINSTSVTGRLEAAFNVVGAVFPVVRDLQSWGVWERFFQEFSVWGGDYTLQTWHGIDMPTQGGFGYGFSSNAGYGSRVSIQGFGCRHLVTGGGGHTRDFSTMNTVTGMSFSGPSYNVHVYDSSSTGAHGGISFDCHEHTGFWTFADCVANANTADYNDLSGAPTSAGFSMRGYMHTLIDCRAKDCNWGFQDSSQTFPFNGVYGVPSFNRYSGCHAENGLRVAALGATYGYQNSAPPFLNQGDFINACTMYQNCFAMNVSTAFNADLQVNKVIIDKGTAIDCDRFFTYSGPVDWVINQGYFDTTRPGIFAAAGAQSVTRNTGTNYTGNCTGVLNGFLVNKTTQTNPTIVLGNAETSAGNSITAYVNGVMTPVNSFELTATSGGALNLVDMEANNFFGRLKVAVVGLGINLNSAGDTALTLSAPLQKYLVQGLIITNCTTNLTTAQVGLFTATGGGGTAIAAAQTLPALTGSATALQQCTLTTAGNTTALTTSTLYFRVTTPQGSAATADVYVRVLDLTAT